MIVRDLQNNPDLVDTLDLSNDGLDTLRWLGRCIGQFRVAMKCFNELDVGYGYKSTVYNWLSDRLVYFQGIHSRLDNRLRGGVASSDDVHVHHCCVHHGCKYGEEDCPVVSGVMQQRSPCEHCY